MSLFAMSLSAIEPAAHSSVAPAVALRLNLGCGPVRPGGWINVDRKPGAGIDIAADIRDGLPIAGASVDYAVAMHLLQDLPCLDIVPALRDVRRVLKRGGVLRAGVPDLERAIHAYLRDDRAYFYVPDEDARSVGAKLVMQAIWYGSVRTPFTWDFACEACARAGFADVRRAAFQRTTTWHDDIVRLDNRERETLFFEAVA
jgi:SAM-dependent methyltransferase